LQLPAPQEVQWKPPLRQAAPTLVATRGQCAANWQSGDNEVARPVKPLEQEK